MLRGVKIIIKINWEKIVSKQEMDTCLEEDCRSVAKGSR